MLKKSAHRRKLLGSAVLVCLLLLVSGCVKVVTPTPVPVNWEIDYDDYVAHGQGWMVDKSTTPPRVVQENVVGNITRFLFTGNELPESFIFEAELGVIEGDVPGSRPYFAVTFNKQYVGSGGPRIPGYQFAFRPSMGHYELVRVTATESQTIATSPYDGPAWQWDLEEWRTFKVVRDGALIECYVDDELIISISDDTYSGGYVGFWTYGTAAVFRNISLRPLDDDSV